MKNLQKRTLFYAILGILIIFACLLMGEVVIRVHLASIGKGGFIRMPDRYLGRVHTTNSHFTNEENYSKEFKIKSQTNSFGLIGDEVAEIKPENTIRILILGDSFTEAVQVNKDETFCVKLQKLLNENPPLKGKRYEVLNAGISGYSPFRHYAYYKRELQKLQSDIILVQLFSNDVYEDHKIRAMSLVDRQGLPVRVSDFFIKEYLENPVVQQEPSKFEDLTYRVGRWISKRSKFYQYIYSKIAGRHKKSKIHQQLTQLPQYNDNNQFFMIQGDNPLFQDVGFRTTAWQNTKKYLLALSELVAQNQATFGIFLIPQEAQVNFESEHPNIKGYFSKPPNQYLNHTLEEFCFTQSIPFVDLLPTFQNHQDLYYPIDGHFNKEGHSVTAEILYEMVSGLKILNPSPKLGTRVSN